MRQLFHLPPSTLRPPSPPLSSPCRPWPSWRGPAPRPGPARRGTAPPGRRRRGRAAVRARNRSGAAPPAAPPGRWPPERKSPMGCGLKNAYNPKMCFSFFFLVNGTHVFLMTSISRSQSYEGTTFYETRDGAQNRRWSLSNSSNFEQYPMSF